MPVFSSVIESSSLFTSFRSLVAVAWGARGGGGVALVVLAPRGKRGKAKRGRNNEAKKRGVCSVALFLRFFFRSCFSSPLALPCFPLLSNQPTTTTKLWTPRTSPRPCVTSSRPSSPKSSPCEGSTRPSCSIAGACSASSRRGGRGTRAGGVHRLGRRGHGGEFVLSWRRGAARKSGVGGGKRGERGEGEEGERAVAWGESAASSAVG